MARGAIANGREGIKKIGGTSERLTTHSNQHVADHDARRVGGSAVGDGDHDEARVSRQLVAVHEGWSQRDWLNGDANERTPNVSPLDQLIQDPVDRRARQRGRRPTRQRRVVDADDGAGGIDQRTPRETVIDREIEPEYAIDTRSLGGSPSLADRADDAEAC